MLICPHLPLQNYKRTIFKLINQHILTRILNIILHKILSTVAKLLYILQQQKRACSY